MSQRVAWVGELVGELVGLVRVVGELVGVPVGECGTRLTIGAKDIMLYIRHWSSV